MISFLEKDIKDDSQTPDISWFAAFLILECFWGHIN
jgi:hypothetical protein